MGSSTAGRAGTIGATFLAALLSIASAQSTGTTPAVTLSPGSLNFSVNTQTGQNTPQQITVSSGGTPVAFTTSVTPASAASWLTISPPAGTTPQTLSISINPNGLTTGTYGAFLNVTAGGQTSSVPVVLNVNQSGGYSAISVTPGALNLTIPPGTTTPITSPLSVTTKVSALPGLNISAIGGAGWLTVAPTNATITTAQPTTVDVTVNPASLTAGTYNALVAISPPGTTGAVVPVTVNVSAPTSLTLSTSQLNFAFQTGTTNPPPQTINISTGGASGVAFTAAATTTSCGSNWLLVTPQTSAAPGSITVQVNPSGLQAGTCTGAITLSAPGTATPTTTIPVSLLVSANPLIQVPTTGPTFNFQTGGNTQIPAQNVQIVSSGNPVTFQVNTTPAAGGVNFLTVTPSNGTSPQAISFGINPTVLSTLAPGTYTQTVTITSAGAGNSPQTFPVTLVVSNNPILSTTQQSVTFNYQIGQSAPSSQILTLNSTGTPLNYVATTTSTGCGGNFLSVTPTTGMTVGAPGSTGQLIVSANTSGITTAETCSGTITLTVPGSTNPAITIPVKLNASTKPLINASVPSINVTAIQNSTAITQQIIALTSTDFTTGLAFTATASTNPAGLTWLSVAPNTGTTPSNLNVIINPAGLPPGVYTGAINVAGASGTATLTIPVTLTVASAIITPSPATLAFAQPTGGPAPSSQTLAVANVPAGTTISASTSTLNGGNNWLTASTSGNNVVVSANAVDANGNALAQGVYQGVVTVIAPGTTPNPLYIPVMLTVGSPQTLSFSVASSNFSYQAGSGSFPNAQTINVTSSGGSVPLNVAFTPGTGGNFLTVTPNGNTTPGQLSVSLNQSVVSNLGPGTYTGTVTISSPNVPNGAQTLPVTLTVAPQGPPVVTSVQNAASNLSGAIAPGEIVAIKGSGLGAATPVLLTLTSNNMVPTNPGGTTVTFDGISAPIIYTSATQINAMVPYEVAGRASTTMVVTRGGQSSPPVQMAVATSAPAIFTITQTGSGQGAILNADNSVNGIDKAAAKGSTIQIFATGEGAISPTGVTGSVTTPTGPFPKPTGNVSVTIGGVPAQVIYAGEAPGLITGVLQVNAIVPSTVASGNQPVVVTVGNNSSLPTVTVDVQ